MRWLKKGKNPKRIKSLWYFICFFVWIILAGYFFATYFIVPNLVSKISSVPPSYPQSTTHSRTSSPEMKKILDLKNTSQQADLYLKLIEKVGPEQAQEELQHSGIVYTGEIHLLNHTVGDYIWKNYGASGLTKCKDYFSSSCYHGFVLNAIGDGNVTRIDEIMKECKKQGAPSYAQCAHAVGHGYLPYMGYKNLLKALEMCDKTKERIADFAADYCQNGVFMENVWGLHDGKPSPDRWIKPEDIRYPCDDPRIAERYLPQCWYNQALQINQFFNGDLVRVAKVCDTVVGEDSKYMCFDGVFRSLHSQTADNLSIKFSKCSQMPQEWKNKCIAIQASASFQQGDRVLPFRICDEAKFGQTECYKELEKMIKYYIQPGKERDRLCNMLTLKQKTTRCSKT